jgi:hypothetical protein
VADISPHKFGLRASADVGVGADHPCHDFTTHNLEGAACS